MLPAALEARDADGFAAGVLAWRIDAGARRRARAARARGAARERRARSRRPRAAATRSWTTALARRRGALARAALRAPRSSCRAPARDVARTLRSALAHVLVNRDGPRLQPGSRNYERSWIRDGALTSSALVQLGHADAARDFLAWYAGFQLENGSLPCCVDARGADPTPEHDSTGAFLYALGEYARHTRRRGLRALALAARAARGGLAREAPQRAAGRRAGARSSAAPRTASCPSRSRTRATRSRPVHSYWDDLFARQGLRDAVFLAGLAGDAERAAAWAKLAADFERDLLASYTAAMKLHGIPHLPGSVELGDFDPTATAVALRARRRGARLPGGRAARDLRALPRRGRRAEGRRDAPRRLRAVRAAHRRRAGPHGRPRAARGTCSR